MRRRFGSRIEMAAERDVDGSHTQHKCLGKFHMGLIRPGRSVDLTSSYMLTRVAAVERLNNLPFGRMFISPFHVAGFPKLKCIAFILLPSILPPPSSRVPKKSTERERSKIESSAEHLPPPPPHRQHRKTYKSFSLFLHNLMQEK